MDERKDGMDVYMNRATTEASAVERSPEATTLLEEIKTRFGELETLLKDPNPDTEKINAKADELAQAAQNLEKNYISQFTVADVKTLAGNANLIVALLSSGTELSVLSNFTDTIAQTLPNMDKKKE